MNNENIKNPLEIVAQTITEMTAAAIELERAREEAEKSATEWYHNWQRKDAELKEMQSMLAAEIEGHKRTRTELQDALDTVVKLSDEIAKLKADSKATTKPKNSAQSPRRLKGV